MIYANYINLYIQAFSPFKKFIKFIFFEENDKEQMIMNFIKYYNVGQN